MNLTKEQVDRRLNSETNISKILTETRAQLELPKTEVEYKDHIKNHVGRNGSRNLSNEERIAIGVIATVAGNQTAADIFDINKDHVSALKNGIRNTSNDNIVVRDENLKQAINERLDRTKLSIQELAATKLLSAIGLLSDDKLENATLKDIATISNSMSQVVRNLTSQREDLNNGKSNVKIIVHQPKPTREESFDCIEIEV